MDKNDFTRIYPVLGPTGGVLVSCSDFQTGISFQESIPGWNTYYKNRQGKTMSMFIYIFLHLRSKCTFVYLHLLPRVNTFTSFLI